MNDLVERLRTAEKHDAYFFPLMRSAADEIEKLRAELKIIEAKTLERAAVELDKIADVSWGEYEYAIRNAADSIRELKCKT